MSDQEQIQQIHAKIGMENLKEFLFTGEKKYVILNPEHRIWLCVNDSSAKELAQKIFAIKAAVTITSCHGVGTEYYHYNKRIAKERAESEVITLTEGFRETFEQYYKLIKREVITKNYTVLAEALGDDRAKALVNCPNVDKLTNQAYNDYRTITSFEERQQLREQGLEIIILEYA